MRNAADERDGGGGDGWPSLLEIHCGRFKIGSVSRVLGRRQKRTCAEEAASAVGFSRPAFADIPNRL